VRRARRLLVPALAATLGLAGSLSLGLISSARADTTTSLPSLKGFQQMAVDSADGYLFLSQGAIGAMSGIVVTRLDGTYVTTLDAGDGVAGIALSNGTLYAAEVAQNEIGVIDAATLTQTQTYAVPAGDIPSTLAVQSGKLWVGYISGGGNNDGIGDVDLSTGTFDQAVTGLVGLPVLAADPSDTGVLVAVSSLGAATYSTAATPVRPIAALGPFGNGCTNEGQLAVVPGGSEFLLACGFPYFVSVISTTTLNLVGSYQTGPYPAAVAITADGTVAAGPGNIQIYGPDGSERNILSAPGGLARNGLAWSADGSTLYAITGLNTGPYSLHVYDSPQVTPAALSLTGPSTAFIGKALTLTGQLSLVVGSPPAGTPVTITRANPDGTTTTLSATAATDASGNFTVIDTPPATGAYTYSASYAGSSAATPATASFTTTVSLAGATLTLTPASATVIKGSPVTLKGMLSLASGPPAPGTALNVSRLNPDDTTTPITGVATDDASGDFSVTDATATATGNYAYTASVPATATTASAQATAQVTIALNSAAISLSGPSSVLPLKSFSVTGKLSLGIGSPATGTPIRVSRENPTGTTTQVTGIASGPGGGFTINDKLSVLGSYIYTASVPATATTTAATGTLKVTVVKGTPTLTLSAGAPTALYDSTLHVTAHLGSTYSNRTVSVYYQLVGTGMRKLLKTATVGSAGNLVLSYPAATRNVIFTAAFSGDAQYSTRTVSVRIGVAARVAMSNGGWYTTTKFNGTTFRVFHHTSHLNVAVTVTPNKRGETVELVAQQWYNNQWNNVTGDVFTGTLNGASTMAGYLTLTGATGGYFRLIADFVPSSKDVTNVSYHSGWFYFSVVK
jgi:5-hydroxyisourate hydrolase-like protein (transthyretin family)